MIIIGIDTAIRKTGYGVIDMRTGGSIRILDCGNTIVDEHTVRELIPELKRLGACGIVEYPLNKIVE